MAASHKPNFRSWPSLLNLQRWMAWHVPIFLMRQKHHSTELSRHNTIQRSLNDANTGSQEDRRSRWHHRVLDKGFIELTVAPTKMTAAGFLGIGKRVTSVRDKTVLMRSTTCSRVIDPFTSSSRISTSQAVPYCKMPSQNATAAECGVKNGSIAKGVGCNDPTMAACTPPVSTSRTNLHLNKSPYTVIGSSPEITNVSNKDTFRCSEKTLLWAFPGYDLTEAMYNIFDFVMVLRHSQGHSRAEKTQIVWRMNKKHT